MQIRTFYNIVSALLHRAAGEIGSAEHIDNFIVVLSGAECTNGAHTLHKNLLTAVGERKCINSCVDKYVDTGKG